MDSSTLSNPNPIVYERSNVLKKDDNEEGLHPLDVFGHLRDIMDPEHPYTLEQLKVIEIENISLDKQNNIVEVKYTPTVEHCSMASLIGLCIRTKLMRSLPKYTKIDIAIYPGSHISEKTITKQINDKERVAAALENNRLLDMIETCLNGKPSYIEEEEDDDDDDFNLENPLLV